MESEESGICKCGGEEASGTGECLCGDKRMETTESGEIQTPVAAEKKNRTYHRFTASEIERVKKAYTEAPKGQKTKVAQSLAQEMGCSAQSIIKHALRLA